MSPRVTIGVLLLSLSAAAAACTPKETSAPSEASATADASSAPTAMATSSSPATADNDPLPSHSDAAKTIRREITKANYKAELDKIEKEIP